MSVVKVVVPAGVVLFVVVSFLFLDGWPFRGTPKVRPTSDPSDVAEKGSDGNDGSSDGSGDVTSEDVQALESRARKSLGDAKSDPERYLAALSDAVLDVSLSRAFRDSLLPEIRASNDKLVFTAEPTRRYTPYTVKRNDNLTKVCNTINRDKKTNMTPAFLMRINRLSSDALRPGQILNVPTQKLALRVHKSDFRLFVLLGSIVVLDYQVGIGKDDGTPEGTFRIDGKTKNPAWTTPEGKVLKYGEPGHLIGSRWLGWVNDAGRTTYGLHGTIDETSIGKAESAGCVRLRKTDLEDLFELIPEGCELIVK